MSSVNCLWVIFQKYSGSGVWMQKYFQKKKKTDWKFCFGEFSWKSPHTFTAHKSPIKLSCHDSMSVILSLLFKAAFLVRNHIVLLRNQNPLLVLFLFFFSLAWISIWLKLYSPIKRNTCLFCLSTVGRFLVQADNGPYCNLSGRDAKNSLWNHSSFKSHTGT